MSLAVLSRGRMAELLNQEEDETFYKEQYGEEVGFLASFLAPLFYLKKKNLLNLNWILFFLGSGSFGLPVLPCFPRQRAGQGRVKVRSCTPHSTVLTMARCCGMSADSRPLHPPAFNCTTQVFKETNSDFDGEGEESWDELDTDFDEDEADDAEAGDEPDEEFQKKRNVYIDPLKPTKRRKVTGAARKRAPRAKTVSAGGSTAARSNRATRSSETGIVRKSKRKGAIEKDKERSTRKENDKNKTPTMKKPKVPVRKLTQTERLREAVKTERENMLSLLRFKQREASKKKAVLRKTTFNGPVLRYHSKCIVREDGVKEAHTFLSFTQTENFLETYFPGSAQLKAQDPKLKKTKPKAKPDSAEKRRNSKEGKGKAGTQVAAPALVGAGTSRISLITSAHNPRVLSAIGAASTPTGMMATTLPMTAGIAGSTIPMTGVMPLNTGVSAVSTNPITFIPTTLNRATTLSTPISIYTATSVSTYTATSSFIPTTTTAGMTYVPTSLPSMSTVGTTGALLNMNMTSKPVGGTSVVVSAQCVRGLCTVWD